MSSSKFLFGMALTFAISSSVRAETSSSADEIKSLQRSLVKLQQKIEPALLRKSHIMLRDQNFTMEGKIEGTMSGSMSQTNRMSSGLAGILVGGLTGGIVGLTTSLGLPTGLFLMGTAGGVLGALNPEKTGEGQIKGNLQGQIKGEGWDNHYEAKNFLVFVVDPSQQKVSPHLENYGFTNDECTQRYSELIKSIVDSRRYFTPSEFQNLTAEITEFQKKLYDLDSLRIEFPEANQMAIQKFLEEKAAWLNKKLTIVNIGDGIQAQPLVMQSYDYELLQAGTRKAAAPIKVRGDLSGDEALKAVHSKITKDFEYVFPDGDRIIEYRHSKIDKATFELIKVDVFLDRWSDKFPLKKQEVIKKIKMKNNDGTVCSSLKDFLPTISNQVEILVKGLDVNSYEMQLALKRTPVSVSRTVQFEE